MVLASLMEAKAEARFRAASFCCLEGVLVFFMSAQLLQCASALIHNTPPQGFGASLLKH